jgi:hypothetical protein
MGIQYFIVFVYVYCVYVGILYLNFICVRIFFVGYIAFVLHMCTYIVLVWVECICVGIRVLYLCGYIVLV